MKDFLLRFIEKAGQQAEVELFLKTFQTLPRMKFAVISVSYEVLRNQLDTLAESIAFMNRMDIYPILVLRLQPADYFESSSPKRKAECGFDPPTLKRLFTMYSRKLIQEIKKRKGRSDVVDHALYWQTLKRRQLKVDQNRILSVMSRSQTAIISPVILDGDSTQVLDADLLARTLVRAIRPKKFIMITEQGGILDENNHLVPFLNLSHTKDWSFVRKDMKRRLREIRDFVASLTNCAIVMTSADHLLKEIFTVKGKGTYIKHHVVYATSHIEDISVKKVKLLLENAFHKTLAPHYFDQDFKEIIYQKDYEGVAIVQEIESIPYLDKFAVGQLYEGTGLGKTLWQKVCRKYPTLVWRSTAYNSLNAFYLRECDGCMKFSNWHVYWRQLDPEQIFPIIEKILKKPATLIEKDPHA